MADCFEIAGSLNNVKFLDLVKLLSASQEGLDTMELFSASVIELIYRRTDGKSVE